MQDTVDVRPTREISLETECIRYSEEGWSQTIVRVPIEKELAININLKEFVTILCTPLKLNFLVIGFLYSEGVITGMTDIAMLRVYDEESKVDVRLASADFDLPKRRRLTSGCGGGPSFITHSQMVESDLEITPKEILVLARQLQKHMDLYRTSGGVHATALADRNKLLMMAEDIGRHNTVDKIQGECIFRGVVTRDCVLLSTGRISSEMLLKAARMGVPIIVSRHSPTGTAVRLADELGIALVGQVRGNRLSIYSHPERLGFRMN
ncbi:MAG: formate dehydrogenase accessory sulfurtransferase FdhD [Syntrophorhabdaceae bacterium]|nr:formate dehydrogenase accessory sulfurtransferase FdhD [Syntrophorhabdales bacterium]MBP9560317.1 formate dehydrogenase accessory sulfurtransferase FdhD [Syntrophorhabdaceae bacterium]